jgi:hypothetical protein
MRIAFLNHNHSINIEIQFGGPILPYDSSLPHPRWADEQQWATILNQILKQIGAPGHCTPNTASEAYNDALPVPNRADTVQRPADSSTIIRSKVPNLAQGTSKLTRDA